MTSAVPNSVPESSPSAGEDPITFADVFSAYQTLQMGLRPLPNEDRMHCEGTLSMVSEAFTGETPSEQFDRWYRTGYLASTLSDVRTRIGAVLLSYSEYLTVDPTGQSAPYMDHAHNATSALDVLVERIAWLNHSPLHMTEINQMWMHSSALIHRMDKLAPEIQTSCEESLQRIKQALETIESFGTSVLTLPPPMDVWVAEVGHSLNTAKPPSATPELDFIPLVRARESVSSIHDLLGRLEEIHMQPLPYSVDPDAESPMSEEP